MPSTSSPVLSAIATAFAVPSREVEVYFAKDGERFDIVTNSGNWSAYETAQVMDALGTYSAVADLSFTVTDDPEAAEFKLTKSASEHGSLAFMNLPDPELGDLQGLAWFNTYNDWSGPNAGLLDAGSYTYTIFLHELGHGLGLAHPFDTGGGSTIMPAIGPGDGLDQGVYTVMTYNDGWPESPAGEPPRPASGWNLTPSPIDIAVLQEVYGANTTTGAGGTRYVLPDQNGPGTGYAAIWDVGGRDTIVHDGRQNASIDLRAATLQPAEGGGGFVSYAEGVHGGFTIAHGVTIENAIGGSGDDTLIGNEADNLLNGRGGDDDMRGGRGNDIYLFDSLGDRAIERRAGDIDEIRTAKVDVALRANPYVENVSLAGHRPLDAEGTRGDNVIAGNKGDNMLLGGAGDDDLFGFLGFDVLDGGDGNDTLTGGSGPDTLTGGRGADTFHIADNDGRVTITDFSGRDRLDLTEFGLDTIADAERGLALAGEDTILQLDGARIVLEGVALSELDGLVLI